MLASYLRAMLTPAMAYDYGLKNQTELALSQYGAYFNGLQEFKPLYSKLMSVRDVFPLGFTPAIIALLGSAAENERFMADLRTKAQSNLVIKSPRTRMKALPVMYGACFGQGSDLFDCMSIISENKTEDIEYVETILSEYCDEQNGVFSLNMSKVEEKLNNAWDSANSKNNFKLEYDARDQALRQYTNRLSVMLAWVEHISMANEYNIHCLAPETRNGYINLLDEMVEMGILNQPRAGIYRLRRNSFVDIIGEDFEKLDEEIKSCNEEE